jgi:hypothetical protein
MGRVIHRDSAHAPIITATNAMSISVVISTMRVVWSASIGARDRKTATCAMRAQAPPQASMLRTQTSKSALSMRATVAPAARLMSAAS